MAKFIRKWGKNDGNAYEVESELARLGLANISGGSANRLVHHNTQAGPQQQYASNVVKTSKYNLVTFLPRFFFEEFSQVAYFYFLVQACLVWWSAVSPFKPYGPLIALIFVVGVGAIKAIFEDRKRHQEDNLMNQSIAHVVQSDGSVTDMPWKRVKVGSILKVFDDEDFPADLLCLYCSLADSICYIKTTNLDGETNLKVRRPLDAKEHAPTTPEEVPAMRITLACEPPNSNLHSFVGKAVLQDDSQYTAGVSINELLLRGCTLKNSGFVMGLVVYTGHETRIQMNSSDPPHKTGTFTRFLNVQVGILISIQLSLCVICAGIALWWRDYHGNRRYFLALTTFDQANYKNGGAFWIIYSITFWLLFSYMVPISLFVTMEIVRLFQAIFINKDPEMRCPTTKQRALARNSNIIEDLGRASYIFSDKTGTLTSNEMRLRGIAVKGASYGNPGFRLEGSQTAPGMASLEAFEPQLAEGARVLQESGFWAAAMKAGGSTKDLLQLAGHKEGLSPESLGLPEASSTSSLDQQKQVLGHHLVDFWTNICVCHNLITEGKLDTPEFRYQGPSPDEVALVEGARQLGFEFRGRTRSHITIAFLGHQEVHEVLVELEFTSERARSSVVTRSPDGTLRLFCKGSDAVMLSRIREDTDAELLDATDGHLHAFSVKGLRTLVIATKVLSAEEWSAWDALYQRAASRLDDREAQVAAVAESLEQGMELMGVTAIEDKLQDGVPEAIQTLIEGGMRVWMITGDKQETAINIGISCGLITDPAHIQMCNVLSADSAGPTLMSLHAARSPSIYSKRTAGELVVDGKTLSYILGTEFEPMLAEVASTCSSVIVCRASPSQKAAIVKMMMAFELRAAEAGAWGPISRAIRRYKWGMQNRMVAIGDGANDVAMIQAAHIGVGIMGKEGRQAVNNSDYAIGQFRFLVRLLMVHGSLSVYRLSRLIKYSFYKNIAFAFLLAFYQIYCGFSGQTLLDGYTASFYNAFFTAFPIGIFAVLDRPFRSLDTYMRFPQQYNSHNPLTARTFWKNGILLGIMHASMVFFIIYYSAIKRGRDSTDDLFSMGKTMFVALVGVVELEIALVSRYWTTVYGVVWTLSYALIFPFLIILPLVTGLGGSADFTTSGVGLQILASPLFWWQIIVVYFFTFGTRFLDRAIRVLIFPNDNEIVAEAEQLIIKEGGRHATTARLHRLSAQSMELPAAPTAKQPVGSSNGLRDTYHSQSERL